MKRRLIVLVCGIVVTGIGLTAGNPVTVTLGVVSVIAAGLTIVTYRKTAPAADPKKENSR